MMILEIVVVLLRVKEESETDLIIGNGHLLLKCVKNDAYLMNGATLSRDESMVDMDGIDP